MFRGLEDIIWTHINILTLRCDVNLTLKIAGNMKLWLMMLQCHTKFGNKMFCDSEDIIQKNIH